MLPGTGNGEPSSIPKGISPMPPRCRNQRSQWRDAGATNRDAVYRNIGKATLADAASSECAMRQSGELEPRGLDAAKNEKGISSLQNARWQKCRPNGSMAGHGRNMVAGKSPDVSISTARPLLRLKAADHRNSSSSHVCLAQWIWRVLRDM